MPEQLRLPCPTCGRPLQMRPARPKITREMRETVKYLRYTKRQKQRDIATSLGISQTSVARILAEPVYG